MDSCELRADASQMNIPTKIYQVGIASCALRPVDLLNLIYGLTAGLPGERG